MCMLIPFLIDHYSLTKHAFVVAQFITPIIFRTYGQTYKSHNEILFIRIGITLRPKYSLNSSIGRNNGYIRPTT